MREIIRSTYLNMIGAFTDIKPGIHILNSHYVTPGEVHIEKNTLIYDNFLSYLKKVGIFITLEEATKRILSNLIPDDKVMLSFTFDDGFEECYTIIAPLLEKYGTRGAFFINSNYISSDKAYQKDFNIRVNTYTKSPMSWDQVRELHRRGHIIGSHNLDHSNFQELSVSDVQYQILKNKEIIENKLNSDCGYFAWTYGQLKHFPPHALEITKNVHKYIFSDTNFKLYFSYNRSVINRRHIEPFWPKAHINYFLGKRKRI
ncbi:MAG TPA: polysaccharide deacetylase family protein [Bacteroidales bacterium]|nr:polysaccharide deacetylase family protein [Bacteroidales bacterium]